MGQKHRVPEKTLLGSRVKSLRRVLTRGVSAFALRNWVSKVGFLIIWVCDVWTVGSVCYAELDFQSRHWWFYGIADVWTFVSVCHVEMDLCKKIWLGSGLAMFRLLIAAIAVFSEKRTIFSTINWIKEKVPATGVCVVFADSKREYVMLFPGTNNIQQHCLSNKALARIRRISAIANSQYSAVKSSSNSSNSK